MPRDINGDGVVNSDDWKLWWARVWLYAVAIVGLLLVALVFPWWVTLTILGVVILVLALNKWATGRWFP